MFADDTIQFFNIKILISLYKIVNVWINKNSKWFKLNKLSLDIKKANYYFP